MRGKSGLGPEVVVKVWRGGREVNEVGGGQEVGVAKVGVLGRAIGVGRAIGENRRLRLGRI